MQYTQRKAPCVHLLPPGECTHRDGVWGVLPKLWLFQRMAVWCLGNLSVHGIHKVCHCNFKRSSLRSYSWSQGSGWLLLCILRNLHSDTEYSPQKVLSKAPGVRILSGSFPALGWWIPKQLLQAAGTKCIRAKCKGRIWLGRASCGSRAETWKSNMRCVCRSQGECEAAAGVGFPAGI